MATLTACNPRIVFLGDAEVKRQRILNGQTWNAGEFLRRDSAGLLQVVATGTGDASGGGIQFQALKDQADPGNSTTFANVMKIANDTIFEGNLFDDTTTQSYPAAAVEGQQYGIDVQSNVHSVDHDETTTVCFEVTEISPDYNESENTLTDVYGRVRFKVLQTCIEAAPAA